MTYSLQAEPFLHIDGDVFLPRVLDEKINNSELVAQNRETGTGYYNVWQKNFCVEIVCFFSHICIKPYWQIQYHRTMLVYLEEMICLLFITIVRRFFDF